MKANGSTRVDTDPEGLYRAPFVPNWKRIVALLFIVIAWFLISAHVWKPFAIPSESMSDTLSIGDRVGVNLMKGNRDVKRGDIVVFNGNKTRWSSEQHESMFESAVRHLSLGAVDMRQSYFVKRVIGLGGDTISCNSDTGELFVNGAQISEPYVAPETKSCTENFTVVVPKCRLWVEGDNRGNSFDSRFHGHDPFRVGDPTGAIMRDSVVGVVGSTVWPPNHISGSESDEGAFSNVPAPKG